MLDSDLPIDQVTDAYRTWRESRGKNVDDVIDMMADEIEMRSILDPGLPDDLAAAPVERAGQADLLDDRLGVLALRVTRAGQEAPEPSQLDRHQLAALVGQYDYVIIQIPKNMSFFEDILCHLTQHLHAQSKVICGSMVKHLAPTSFDLLNKYIGKTTTSLAQKKARLVFADFEKTAVMSPYPLSVKIDSFEIPFINHSNLFSRDKLDIGTRFFLEHIPRGDFKSILDLGCANGIIGIKAKMTNPGASILFSDDSAMAIESARTNYENNFQDEATYFWTNCFEGQPGNTLDLVLCNPPFHQGNTIGDFIAWQMFQDAYDALKSGGTLRVIGNSHLGYQIKLKKLFGNSHIVATNNKFIICDARK